MGVLRLRLLGEFGADDGDKPVNIASKKGQALLAILALSDDQRQSRDKLTLLLWGDRPEERARHSLRQIVLTLRKNLGDSLSGVIISDGDWLTLDTNGVDVDTLDFERLAAAGETGFTRAGLGAVRRRAARRSEHPFPPSSKAGWPGSVFAFAISPWAAYRAWPSEKTRREMPSGRSKLPRKCWRLTLRTSRPIDT